MTVNVDAASVKKLRDVTGAGFMECKKALIEARGDFASAQEILRVRGSDRVAKKTDRETTTGVVSSCVSDDGSFAVAVKLGCETDFVARNADFIKLASDIAKVAFDKRTDDISFILSSATGDNGNNISDAINKSIASLGENIVFSDCCFLRSQGGVVVVYMHNKYSENAARSLAMVSLSCEPAADDIVRGTLSDLGEKLAMHALAMNPLAISPEGIRSEKIEEERRIAREKTLAEGRPESIVDKIVLGRIEKFLKESSFSDQVFVMDGKTKVSDLIKHEAAKLNKEIKLSSYVVLKTD